MRSFNLSILLILFAVNNTKAINYASYRFNDTVSIDVTRGTPRTTREILEKLNNVQITSPESLQDGTEHLLQFAALLRTKILDTFGILIYDYYDDFDMNEMHSLYRIYQDTLERKYNIFDIIPNVFINMDLKPLSICNYINYHVQTCLRQISYVCAKSKFPEIEQDHSIDNSSIEIARSIYESAHLEEKYDHGISLQSILDFLKSNRLQLTPELFSGLLHNIHYDDFDDGVRTAERELIHYFLTNARRPSRRSLLKAQAIKQYSSVTKLLKGFLQSYQFPPDIKHHAEYLSAHISREPNAINENIELLGAAYEDGDINLRYLFELIFPDDAHDSDIIDARNYLLEQMLKQNILENHLRVEKYQQALPNQMLMGILGQLRDIDFITDITTSLHLHAKYWHSSHMIENLNQLMELFDAYENLRGIPEHRKLISTIDRLRKKLTNSNNATIEMSCTNPRNCLRIGLNIILQCNGINKETKRLINRFLIKSNFQCANQKWLNSHQKSPENHETVSKKPVVSTTRKNLEHQLKAKKVAASDLTTEAPTVPTKLHANPNCNDDEPCEEDDVLATGDTLLHDANITVEGNTSSQAVEREAPELINASTIPPINEGSTETLPIEDLFHEAILNTGENTTADCSNGQCQKNESSIQEALDVTTTPSSLLSSSSSSSDLDKKISDSSTSRPSHSNIGTTLSSLPLTTRISSTKVPSNLELFTTTQEPIVTTSKPTCQHRDLHYRQKLRRLEKIDKSRLKTVHRDDVENLKAVDENKDTISVSATNSAVESSVSGNGDHTHIKEHSKSGSGATTSHGTGQHLEKVIETVGDHSKTKLLSDQGATMSVESGSTHSTGTTHLNKIIDGKSNLDSVKKHHSELDALAGLGMDSSQDDLSMMHSASKKLKAKSDSKDKLKHKLQANDDDVESTEKIIKHGKHHSGDGHKKNLRESKETLELKQKLIADRDDAESMENDSSHAKHKSRNKEMNLLSKLKNVRGGLRRTHVLEAAESQSELSGHHETSDSSTGSGFDKSQHSRRDHGKTEEASTTEHRRKITQQYRESSRRNMKKSRKRDSTHGESTSIGTSEEPAAKHHSGKQSSHTLGRPTAFRHSGERVVPLTSKEMDAAGRLFDWNTPLLSNYDVAMNDKQPQNPYYRGKRGVNKNENKNVNANSYSDKDDVESRLFDINLPFFSNYDVALNDKMPNQQRSRVRRDTTATKDENSTKSETSARKKALNSTGDVSDRLFDFNLPMGSNQKWRLNAPESSQPLAQARMETTTRKRVYRSRRDTVKKNDTHVNETKSPNNDTNIVKPTADNNSTDLKARFLDSPASSSASTVHLTTPEPDKHKANATSKNTTDDAKGRFDFYLPQLGHEKHKVWKRHAILQFTGQDDDDDSEYKMALHETKAGHSKPKSRRGRDTENEVEDDTSAAVNPSNIHSERRNVDTLYSRFKVDVPQDNDDVGDRLLFDFNLPMGSNQKWRFNAPEDGEKKNYRSRRAADATTTSTITTVTNSPLNTDKNISNNHNNISTTATTVSTITLSAIELRMGNDNGTIADSNTTEKINATTVAKQ